MRFLKRLQRVLMSWSWRSYFCDADKKERSKPWCFSRSWQTRLASSILDPVSGSLLSVWKAQKKWRVMVEGKEPSELARSPQAKEMGEHLLEVSALPLTSMTSEWRDVSHCLNLELAMKYSVRSCSRRLKTRPAVRVLSMSKGAPSGSCRRIRRSLRDLITGASVHTSTARSQLYMY